MTKADTVNSDELREQLLAVEALGEEVMSAERAARAKRAAHRAKQKGKGPKGKGRRRMMLCLREGFGPCG